MWREKRLYKRLTLSLPIDYESLDTERKECFSSVCKDISEGGVRLVCHRFHPPKTKFLLKINLEKVNKIIEAIAEVAWSFNMQFSHRYYGGLRFVEMSSLDQGVLKEYIQMQEITSAAG
jgi:c-di-GMP-binding flagellar brake protein YcgR